MTHLLRTYDRGVLRVTINRPGKRNALSRKALRELRVVFEAHAAHAAEGAAALDAIRAFPVPTVAALNGLALGGGAELALACDLRMAAPHARIGFTHATLNTSSGWGGGTDLMRAVGPAVALDLLATGRVLTAEEARTAGLVQHVAPPGGTFVDFVDRFANGLAERPPHVLRAFKSLALAARLGAS